MLHINLQRYSEDKACASPDGLKQKLMADLEKSASAIHLQRNRVMVATYVRSNITAGGVILTAKTGEEDRWMGKIGLVLKYGPIAFHYDECERWSEAGHSDADIISEFDLPQVGDWVAYRNSESYEMMLAIEGTRGEGASVRVLYDDAIICKLSDPTVIW